MTKPSLIFGPFKLDAAGCGVTATPSRSAGGGGSAGVARLDEVTRLRAQGAQISAFEARRLMGMAE